MVTALVGELVAVLRADYARNPTRDARTTLAIWRVGQALHGRLGAAAFLLRRVHHLADAVWTRGYIGADLPSEARAGGGLRLPHGGRGVVLHPSVRLGAGVTLYHQVTIGVVDDRPAAVVGDGVYIGSGAKVLGPIELGAECRVGANAVVLIDVPPGTTAVGVPAVVRPPRPPAA